MRHDGLKTCLFVLSLLVCGGTLPASAQDGKGSAVEVDMSVLNAMQPAAGRDPYYKPLSRRSAVLTGERSSGTAARMAQQPQQAEPSAPAPSYYWPVDQERPVRTIAPPQQLAAPQQPDSASKIISYPVTVRQRSELVDPSLEKARYTGQHLVKEEPKKNFTPPLPDFKPVAISRKAAEVAVPVPPERPKVETASAHLIEDAKKQLAEQQKANLFTASVKGPSGPAMPAVPAQKVYAEPLRPEPVVPASGQPSVMAAKGSNDPLASSLVAPDKDTMINTIAAIAARMKGASGKNAGVSVPLPPEKPAVIQKAIASAEQVMDLTSIEPAAGLDVASRQPVIDITEDISVIEPQPAAPAKNAKKSVPRLPPAETQSQYEQDYVSLPFPADADSLDDPTAAKLVQDVLPLLKDNPDWRVQIQAFATNADEKLKGARRISLSRALSIRSYLLEQGIEARRMDVRALGMQTDRQPADRVDFVFFDPNVTQ